MLNMSTWPTVTEKIVNLQLDEANIRIDIQNPSQDAIIQDLFANEGAMQIVESVLTNGFFNNELPVVLKEGKKHIVLEGNRRVAALKAILNPRLAPNYESKIKELIGAQDIAPLREIELKVAPSREDASRLISSIHTIRSRRSWRPLRQAYFYYAQLDNGKKVEDLILEYPNVDIPRFIKMWEMHKIARSIEYDDPKTQTGVSSRNFEISTFERLYQNDKFRDKFGLTFDKYGRVKVGAKMDDFKKSLKQVVTDIVTGEVNSRKINKEDQLNTYLDKWSSPDKKPDDKPKTSKDFEPVEPPKRQATPTALIPKSFQSTLGVAGIERRLAELQKLPYRIYPNTAHDAVRSLLECGLKAYCQKQGITLKPKQQGGFVFLNDALVATQQHLQANNLRKDLVQVIGKVLKNANKFSVKENLDAINHNHNIFSTGDEVKDAWDTVSALIEYILDPK